MKQQKILFILHLPPPIHGAAMLGQFIVDSEIINSNYETKYINLGTTKTFKERKRVTFSKLSHFFKLFKSCFSAYNTFKPDLVYLSLTSNGMGFYKDALIVFMLKLKGAKLVYHFHNKGIKNHQHKFLDNLLYKRVLKNVDIVLGSKWIYEDIQKYVSLDKVQYCHNGIPKVTYEIKKRELKSEDSPTEILFLSNLIESKGVYTLLNACKHLDERGLDFRCTYVGNEGDIKTEEIQAEIEKLKLSNKVVYAGKKYDKEKHEAFEKAHIFAFPTHYPNECFPLVLLEAMQYSLPVISTPEGGVRDIIDDNKTGFIVPQKDAKGLADKLEVLIKNPSLQLELGKSGYEKYHKEFTVEMYGKRLDHIFKKALSK
jgi:glycosyltransferase involved in cell wall biosynthesis